MRVTGSGEHVPVRLWWAPWRRVCRCGERLFPCVAARSLLIEGRLREYEGAPAWNGPTPVFGSPVLRGETS